MNKKTARRLRLSNILLTVGVLGVFAAIMLLPFFRQQWDIVVGALIVCIVVGVIGYVIEPRRRNSVMERHNSMYPRVEDDDSSK